MSADLSTALPLSVVVPRLKPEICGDRRVLVVDDEPITRKIAKVLLEQNFLANLALLLALVFVVALLAYLRRVARERSTAGPADATTDRSSGDHASTAE